jgi:hypothetical protein
MWRDYEKKDVQNVLQQSQTLMESGQKEIFDLAIVKSILKSGDSESTVSQHMGTLTKALDAVGRVLMSFYWHQEDFKDRYGKETLPEIESGLKNTFEALGEAIMTLRSDVTESPYDRGLISMDEVARG